MTLANSIEKKIRAERNTRFKNLGLAKEFIAPNYGGRSIVNVPASMVNILGGQIQTPPLDSAIIKKYSTGVERIVFVIADAMGYQRLNDALADNPQNGFHKLLVHGGELTPLTSVFPSTTTAALTSLWSGYTPAEHGFVGYQLFLREYGVRANMIAFSPVVTEKLAGQQLINAGLEPEKFLPVPSLPQTLAQAGVATYNLIEQPYAQSGLSHAQIRGVKETRGFVTSSDMWVVLRQLLEEKRHERALFAAYWSALDGIQHTYGPSSETVIAEINNLAYSFESEFLRRLSPAACEGTLFLLTADHGQLAAPMTRAVYLRDHPDLRDRLVMDFAGEARAAYLYCRNGEKQAVHDYLTMQLGDKFCVIDSQIALNGGLFGPEPFASEIKFRIGDWIVLPRKNYFLWDRADESKMLGRHGGLAEEEMLVPLIVARLDG